jgi:NAD(P)-dependent dehydrogenase (short-subunit alcohol dehydrogenase family)
VERKAPVPLLDIPKPSRDQIAQFFSTVMRLAIAVAVLVAAYAAFDFWCSTPVVFSGAVVVTGASSGIGRHAAFYLASRGFVVYPTYRKESDAASLTAEAARLGLEKLVRPLKMEVVNETSVKAAVATVASGGVPLVGVVNNAGLTGGGAPLELDTEQQLRIVMEVNFFGAMRVARLFVPLLRQSGGRVVSVSSLKGSIATPGSSGYCASKAALDIAMRCLARETLHLGVRVVTVQPGYIATDILANLDREFVDAQKKLADSPKGRLYPGFRRYLNGSVSFVAWFPLSHFNARYV